MKLDDIKTIGIAGVGLMGTGIAQTFANKGYMVIATDISLQVLESSRELITIYNESLIKEEILTEEGAEQIIDNIVYTEDRKELSKADIIIESIIEDLEAKQRFWQDIEYIAKTNAIFGTNTSGLSITKIAEQMNDRTRLAGIHFWNPPHIIPLVEIIRGEDTGDETLNIFVELIEHIGKEPVVVQKDVNGFIGNRIQFAVLREALNIVEEGIATVDDVDKAMKYGPGLRYSIMGPLEIADLGGLDTFFNISSYLFKDLSDTKEPQDLLRHLINNKEFGLKSKKGFYDYTGVDHEQIIKDRDKRLFKLLKNIYKDQ